VTVFVVTGYLIATLVLSVPAGSVADRVGYTRALLWGRWMFAAGSIIGTLAPTLGIVVVGRLLMAAGGALINPTAMALLRVSMPPERRSRAFGTMGAVMGGAAAVGPALGAALVALFGWRSLFLINLPLLAISWLLQPPVGQAPAAGRPPAAFDWQGSLLTGAALVLVTFSARSGGLAAAWMAAVAMVLFVVLLRHERRVANPVLQTALFRERAFTAGALVIATQNLAMYSLLIQVPFLFGDGTTDSRLGLAIIAMTATMAVMAPVGGRLVERVGVRAVVVAGGLLAAAGVAALAQLPPTASSLQIAGRPSECVGAHRGSIATRRDSVRDRVDVEVSGCHRRHRDPRLCLRRGDRRADQASRCALDVRRGPPRIRRPGCDVAVLPASRLKLLHALSSGATARRAARARRRPASGARAARCTRS
jgi:MFS family permease